MDIDREIYSGGFFSLLQFLEAKEQPFETPLEVIPPHDVDLKALHQGVVELALFNQDADLNKTHAKWQVLVAEFEGDCSLHLTHAMVIAILRRRDPPDEAVQLFLRIWQEMGDTLANELPVRWLISAATTFADHGVTNAQRQGGLGLSMLFDLIKLHDSERRISGKPNSKAFARIKGVFKQSPMAFDMDAYSVKSGDLDKHMLARLWRFAEQDVVLRPLGVRMLRLVMQDTRTVFSRLQHYKRVDGNVR